MPRFPSDDCPHCDYALIGLPERSIVCPECGGSLSHSAFAAATARRLVRHSRGRMALLISPLIGVFAIVPFAIARHGGFFALGVFSLCIWSGATIAVYATDRRPQRDGRLRRALLLGAPIGLVYLLALLLASLLVIVVLVFGGALVGKVQ